MKQTTSNMEPVLVLRGGAGQGGRQWIFVPKGWDLSELEQRFVFTGRAGEDGRSCRVGRDDVRALIALYGEQALLDLPVHTPLSTLLARGGPLVDLMIAQR